MLASIHQIFENFKASPARKNKLIIICSIIGLLINLGIWALLLFKFRPIALANPEKLSLPLHYNIYWGIDLYGQWYQSLYVPALGLGILIVNFILAIYFYSKKIMVSYFFSFATLLTQSFLAIATLLTILINI
ncbi:MAG TPA: hypothetical protein VMX18_01915 [Candidatus Bipolaricaulota bacterium]|nr:hypothetical protein [Candidatus Bipolaricaulota bacterium]